MVSRVRFSNSLYHPKMVHLLPGSAFSNSPYHPKDVAVGPPVCGSNATTSRIGVPWYRLDAMGPRRCVREMVLPRHRWYAGGSPWALDTMECFVRPRVLPKSVFRSCRLDVSTSVRPVMGCPYISYRSDASPNPAGSSLLALVVRIDQLSADLLCRRSRF